MLTRIIEDVLSEVRDECSAAMTNFSPYNSSHEGYAVILEELEELKTEVFRKSAERSIPQMRHEAIQVAATAVRYVIEVCDHIGAEARLPREDAQRLLLDVLYCEEPNCPTCAAKIAEVLKVGWGQEQC